MVFIRIYLVEPIEIRPVETLPIFNNSSMPDQSENNEIELASK